MVAKDRLILSDLESLRMKDTKELATNMVAMTPSVNSTNRAASSPARGEVETLTKMKAGTNTYRFSLTRVVKSSRNFRSMPHPAKISSRMGRQMSRKMMSSDSMVFPRTLRSRNHSAQDLIGEGAGSRFRTGRYSWDSPFSGSTPNREGFGNPSRQCH